MRTAIAYRTYHDTYTSSDVWCDGGLVCYMLELPWLDNRHNVSCIPEGRYTCYYDNKPDKYWVRGVRDRTAIQIHRANTVQDIKGCLGTSTRIIFGYGFFSRVAFDKLHATVGDVFELILTVGPKTNLIGGIRYA